MQEDNNAEQTYGQTYSPIGVLSDWAPPNYPSFIVNAYFLAYADYTEAELRFKTKFFSVLVNIFDFILWCLIIWAVIKSWYIDQSKWQFPLLVKCTIDTTLFILFPSFLRAAAKNPIKIIVPLLLTSIVCGIMAYMSTGWGKEYLIEISTGIFFLITFNFFIHHYFKNKLSKSAIQFSYGILYILLFWLAILAILIVNTLGDGFVRNYITQLGFGILLSFLVPILSTIKKRKKIILVLLFISAVGSTILSFLQTGILQSFLFQLSLNLWMLLALDYAFKIFQKRTITKLKLSHKKYDTFHENREQAESEEAFGFGPYNNDSPTTGN